MEKDDHRRMNPPSSITFQKSEAVGAKSGRLLKPDTSLQQAAAGGGYKFSELNLKKSYPRLFSE
jgi:hypothetical protein